MDMFFAGVELLHYPELRGMPMVVGGRSADVPELLPDGTRHFHRLREYAGRGVVTTSTYEARALGVFSAMSMMKAARLAPDAVLLPANFDAYRHYSRLFKQAVASITQDIEDRGIDEIYIDLTNRPEESRALASQIKQAVRDATGLSCSICIAPNKLLAKIGSDLDKPDGLTILDEASIPSRIWPLSVGKINGIGPKAAQKLAGAWHRNNRGIGAGRSGNAAKALWPELCGLAYQCCVRPGQPPRRDPLGTQVRQSRNHV